MHIVKLITNDAIAYHLCNVYQFPLQSLTQAHAETLTCLEAIPMIVNDMSTCRED